MIVFIAGCSAMKKTTSRYNSGNAVELTTVDQIKKLNITNNDFNIIKAEIEITNNLERRKLIGNMKFKKQGIYLISIRNLTGLEAVRIFIDKDTILINDRINKKLYRGSTDYLNNKYGISTSFLPAILGDYISEINENDTVICRDGIAGIREKTFKNEIFYTIDCNTGKISNVQSVDLLTGNGIKIRFDRIENNREAAFAKHIEITGSDGETRINVKIERIETVDQNEIFFIPGKNYDEVLLK